METERCFESARDTATYWQLFILKRIAVRRERRGGGAGWGLGDGALLLIHNYDMKARATVTLFWCHAPRFNKTLCCDGLISSA